MKKNLSVLFVTILVLGACSKKSSGNSNNSYDPNNPNNLPPDISWSGQDSNYVPPGNCGQSSQLPSNCNGNYNGYSLCGNQWYMEYNNIVWAFPANGKTCGGNSSDDNWWDDYNTGNNNDSNDDDDDSDSDSSYDTGWKKLWSNMGKSKSASIVITVPADGTYYISVKGDYSGKKEDEEKLKVKFDGSNSHKIIDLDNSSSKTVAKKCKVNTNFKLKGGKSYRIYLSGDEDSVDNAQLRITDFWPSDISKLCD